MGIRGNEEVDVLAKSATLEAPRIKTVHFTDFYEKFKTNAILQTEYCIKLQGKDKGKEYFKDMYKKSAKPWFEKVHHSRHTIVTINRLRSNHYNLNASLARSHIVNDANCKCGEFEETIDHVLWQCNLYNQQRKDLIETLRKARFQLPLNTKSLIQSPNLHACEAISKFLKNCGLRV